VNPLIATSGKPTGLSTVATPHGWRPTCLPTPKPGCLPPHLLVVHLLVDPHGATPSIGPRWSNTACGSCFVHARRPNDCASVDRTSVPRASAGHHTSNRMRGNVQVSVTGHLLGPAVPRSHDARRSSGAAIGLSSYRIESRSGPKARAGGRRRVDRPGRSRSLDDRLRDREEARPGVWPAPGPCFVCAPSYPGCP
jgi:hypothetical protein